MKISKLFHWLYAFLMLLPVFALMPSMFYFAFNQKADNYTYQSVTETYEYETNEVNSVDDLVIGNIYKYDITLNDINNWFLNNPNSTDFYLFSQTKGIYKFYYDTTNFLTMYSDTNTLRMFYRKANTTLYLYNGYNYNSFLNENTPTPVSFNFYIIYGGTNATTDGNIQYISASDYLGEKSVTITESEQSPMNIFYSSVDKLFTMPIFAWAKTSFLVIPFTYIGNLFGLQATSPVIYMLSYWLAISIVWLVFDLIMYVPLLVHRWIDKGIVE